MALDPEVESIIALVLNLMVPGLGTIIWGNQSDGKTQLILTIVGVLTVWIFGLGLLFLAISWIWALFSSIEMVKAQRAK